MGADVTLVSWADTIQGWSVARYRTWLDTFESEADRRDFDAWFFGDALSAGRWDCWEVGPWSPTAAMLTNDPARYIPGPTAAVFDRWSQPRIVTRAVIASTMVDLSRADVSAYRKHERAPVARQLRRWMVEQFGRIMWAESW